MSNLLINDYPLIVLPKLAIKIGLNEAMFLQQVHFLINSKKMIKDTRTFKKGYYWVYNTLDDWKKQFPFWSKSTIRRIIKSLKKYNLLIVNKELNNKKYDKTLWYRVDYNELKKIEKEVNNVQERNDSKKCSKWTDGNSQIEHMDMSKMDTSHVSKMNTPIPKNKNINNNNKCKLSTTNITNFKKAFGQTPNDFQKEKLNKINGKLLNYIIKWVGERGKNIGYLIKVIDDVIESNISNTEGFTKHIEERKINKGYNTHKKNKPLKKDCLTSEGDNLEELYKKGYK